MGFWEGLLKFGNFLDSISDDTFEKYKDELNNAIAKDENKLFGNFSKEGFKAIYDLLISNADKEIYIFCKNYSVIFDEESFTFLKYVAEKFERTKGIIILCTYDGKKDDKFLNLEKKVSSFKYYPFELIDKNKITNNFIVVDSKRYWLEDTVYDRNSLNDHFKACCNFNDVLKSIKLLGFVNELIIQIKNKDK